mgnify:CR=1 FL=1
MGRGFIVSGQNKIPAGMSCRDRGYTCQGGGKKKKKKKMTFTAVFLLSVLLLPVILSDLSIYKSMLMPECYAHVELPVFRNLLRIRTSNR